jgi:hypothetical protein
MNAKELIEAEAEWLWKDNGNAFHEWRTVSEHDKQIWRHIALAHFRFLNECGVRMLDEANSDNPETTLVAVNRLPEKEG